jgi:host factor-I protein
MPLRPPNKSKTPPPEETFEEAAYLKALGEKQKLVSVKLQGGEVVRGWIEYYDRNMLRLTREGAPNLFIFKSEIMYIAEGEITVPKVRRAKAATAAVPQKPLTPEASDLPLA